MVSRPFHSIVKIYVFRLHCSSVLVHAVRTRLTTSLHSRTDDEQESLALAAGQEANARSPVYPAHICRARHQRPALGGCSHCVPTSSALLDTLAPRMDSGPPTCARCRSHQRHRQCNSTNRLCKERQDVKTKKTSDVRTLVFAGSFDDRCRCNLRHRHQLGNCR